VSQESSQSQKQQFVEAIMPRSQDFSQWYVDVVRKANLADYSSMKGCMVIKPYGFALWELVRDPLDQRIKATGHENAYFPLLVPESLLTKEANHIEGFAPECAWVTHGGSEKLEERLAIRPTSEAIICSIYANWIQSWRDLPLLINQWANVVRWEKVTRLFLRTTEFLWQEGHTCHATAEEAREETLKMLRVYEEFANTVLAIPVIAGMKTENERFPGAQDTFTVEALMGDGKALQAGTSHDLGQHFAKMFDISFEDKDGQRKLVHQTSWGMTTRLIGAVIMVHGDDNGLILPPKIAPHQVVIVPIFKSANQAEVCAKAAEVAETLKAVGVRVKLDTDDQHSPGWKYAEYEMRGVPLRIEIGPKDIEKGHVMAVRRDNRAKETVPFAELTSRIPALLDQLQADLLQRAKDFREASTHRVANFDEFKETIETKRGFVFAPWSGDSDDEVAIKTETKATIRCIPIDAEGNPIPAPAGAKCIFSGKPAKYEVYFARSY
jgi:prolyl-tRNA synthetase